MGKRKEILYMNDRFCGQSLDATTCSQLEVLLRLDEEDGFVEELKHLIYELTPSEVDIILESKSTEFVELKRGLLENIQTTGIAYMYFAKKLILGDSVGLGKTVEVWGLCNLIESTLAKEGQPFKFLFLTGKSLIPQARRSAVTFTGKYVDQLYGEAGDIKKFRKNNPEELEHSIVGAHSLLTSIHFQEYLREYMQDYGYFPFDLIVIDESGDILTNTNTQIYKSGSFLVENCDRVILLNATSFEKELRQFYAQLSFVDPTFLPTKTDFASTYEVQSYNGRYSEFSGKYKNQEKFRDLIAYRYLARTRKGIGATMTNCSAEVIVSDLSKEQKKLLELVSMPLMVYDCPSYFPMSDVPTNTETTPKLADLLRLLLTDLRDVGPVLVYARYKEAQYCAQQILESKGIRTEVMNGDTSNKTREDLINTFKLGDLDVLITSVQKGLDFGNCNYCIFLDYDPNPNKMVQFEGRMTRSFDIINKHVYVLISRGKELKSFKNILSDRAQASDLFAGSDFSCILSILLDEENLKKLK